MLIEIAELSVPVFEHWWQFFGKLHPLVVHFPIVLLTILFIIDLLYLIVRDNSHFFPIRSVVLYSTVGITIPTIVTGFFASWFYPETDVLIQHHKSLGIFTFLMIIGHSIVWYSTSGERRKKYFFVFLLLSLGSIILVSITGEAGGIIIRETTPFQTKINLKQPKILNDSFLVKRYNLEKLDSYLRENITYIDVKPIFEQNGCIQCHSEHFSQPNLEGFFQGEMKWLNKTPDGKIEDFTKSVFYNKVILNNTMPPKGYLRDQPGLPPADRLILIEWLKNGMKESTPQEEEAPELSE